MFTLFMTVVLHAASRNFQRFHFKFLRTMLDAFSKLKVKQVGK